MELFLSLIAIVACISAALADGAAVVVALDTIAAKTDTLNETVASWDGHLLGTLPIVIKSTDLLDAINDATEAAEQSAPLNNIEAVTVALATNNLVSDTNSTLTTIITARPKFDHLLLRPVILLNLKQQKEASSRFSAAVIEKVPEALQDAAKAIVAKLDASLEAALEVYQLF